MLKRIFTLLLVCFLTTPALAQDGPLRLTITDGVIEPLPFAIPAFQAETAGSEQLANDITRLVAQDLVNTGLFREIGSEAFISQPASFGAPLAYADWRAINAQAVIGGAVAVNGDQVTVKFRLYDVFSGEELGGGLQFAGTVQGWRRIRWPMPLIPGSPAKAAISTAASSSCPRPAPRTTVKSALQSWITMARMCNS